MRPTVDLMLICLLLPLPSWSAQRALFDTHLHYNTEDAQQYSPAQIISILDQHQIQQAVVTSTPAALALTLYRHAPERILPFLGIYRSATDKQHWPWDKELPQRVQHALNNDSWRGLGELHLFAEQRHSPVFRQLIALAAKHHLPLLIHSDPAVIDSLFEQQPEAVVIWAHAGAYPYPALLDDYLRRYPGLYVDLSVRDERIAPKGQLDENWFWLLAEHADRFLVGVDTYRTTRWDNYGVVVTTTKQWLTQLPDDVAEKIRRENAEKLFNTKPQSTPTTSGPTDTARHPE